jgi:hypothetical protein
MTNLRLRHLVLLLLVAPAVAGACQCVTPLSIQTAYQRADLVVTGQAQQVAVLDAASQTTETTFQISASWKADAVSELVVVSGETCAEKFEQGKTWLVFLTKLDNGRYATNRCVGNLPLEPGAKGAERALRWLKIHGRHGAAPHG